MTFHIELYGGKDLKNGGGCVSEEKHGAVSILSQRSSDGINVCPRYIKSHKYNFPECISNEFSF